MKKMFFFVFSLMFAMMFVACDKSESKETNDVTPPTDDTVQTDDVTPVDDSDTPADEDVVDEPSDEDTGPTPCKLEDTFFDEMPTDWESYFTLKMSGIINDPNAEDIEFAFLTKVNAKILGINYNLGSQYGAYILDSVQDAEGNTYPAVIGVGVGNVKWPITNKLASLWAGQVFWVVEDLMNWKQQAETEGYTGVKVEGTTQVAVFEVWIEIAGSAAQYTRMECIRGIGALNAEETAFEGAMFVCVDQNTEWAVGETMKAMDYAKLIDDPEEILAVINEGLDPRDQNYRTDVCRCFTKDEQLMDCEDMKDEFGLGELPDEEPSDADVVPDNVVPDNVVPDEDAADDLLPDN